MVLYIHSVRHFPSQRLLLGSDHFLLLPSFDQTPQPLNLQPLDQSLHLGMHLRKRPYLQRPLPSTVSDVPGATGRLPSWNPASFQDRMAVDGILRVSFVVERVTRNGRANPDVAKSWIEMQSWIEKVGRGVQLA